MARLGRYGHRFTDLAQLESNDPKRAVLTRPDVNTVLRVMPISGRDDVKRKRARCEAGEREETLRIRRSPPSEACIGISQDGFDVGDTRARWILHGPGKRTGNVLSRSERGERQAP